FRSGRCDARISGMGGRQTSALDADMGDESDSWRQPGTERIAHCGVDCHKDPISVKLGTAMNVHKQLVALCVLMVITALPAAAQVERVAVRTTGISCGTCAAVSEFYLRRLPSIDKVDISLKNEAVMVSYKPG